MLSLAGECTKSNSLPGWQCPHNQSNPIRTPRRSFPHWVFQCTAEAPTCSKQTSLTDAHALHQLLHSSPVFCVYPFSCPFLLLVFISSTKAHLIPSTERREEEEGLERRVVTEYCEEPLNQVKDKWYTKLSGHFQGRAKHPQK